MDQTANANFRILRFFPGLSRIFREFLWVYDFSRIFKDFSGNSQDFTRFFHGLSRISILISDNSVQCLVSPCYSLVLLGNWVCCARGRPLGPHISFMPFADSIFAARDRPPGSLIFFSACFLAFAIPGVTRGVSLHSSPPFLRTSPC